MLCCFGHKACGILAYPPGTEAAPPGFEGEVLTTGLPRNFLIIFFHFYVYIPHKGEIIQYLALSVWLISLSMTSCSLSMLCANGKISLFHAWVIFHCAYVLQFLLLFYSWFTMLCLFIFSAAPEACGILVPQTGIEPASPALEGEVLTTGPSGRSLYHSFFFVAIVVVFGLLFIFN